MTRARFLAVVSTGLLLSACGRKRTSLAQVPAPPTPAPQQPEPAAPTAANATENNTPEIPPAPGRPLSDVAPETGLASWYGHPYHGRASASGEIYDMEQMTAAHRTLPFGTVVHVENLDNGMTTEVRINDRGPFVDGRIIDLSHAAAGAIQMVGPGVAHVRVTIVSVPAKPELPVFAVQVSAFANRDNADRMQAHMTGLYGAAALRLRAGTPPLWRVLVGRAPSTDAAELLARRIRTEQSVPEAFVVRLDPPVNALRSAATP